jgi:hypothetical protein
MREGARKRIIDDSFSGPVHAAIANKTKNASAWTVPAAADGFTMGHLAALHLRDRRVARGCMALARQMTIIRRLYLSDGQGTLAAFVAPPSPCLVFSLV